MRSPLDPANANQLATGGHAALVEFEIRGDADKAAEKIDPILDRVDEVAAGASRSFFIGRVRRRERGRRASNTAFGDDLSKAGLLLAPDHAASSS